MSEGSAQPGLLAALKFFLWFICAFHVGVGLGLNLFPGFPELVAQYYGATVDWTPALQYIVKPVGAFMLVLGVLAAVAALDPLRYPPIIYGFVLLFCVRGLQRIVFQGEIETAVGIASGRNLGNAAFFILMAVALALIYRFAKKQ